MTYGSKQTSKSHTRQTTPTPFFCTHFHTTQQAHTHTQTYQHPSRLSIFNVTCWFMCVSSPTHTAGESVVHCLRRASSLESFIIIFLSHGICVCVCVCRVWGGKFGFDGQYLHWLSNVIPYICEWWCIIQKGGNTNIIQYDIPHLVSHLYICVQGGRTDRNRTVFNVRLRINVLKINTGYCTLIRSQLV